MISTTFNAGATIRNSVMACLLGLIAGCQSHRQPLIAPSSSLVVHVVGDSSGYEDVWIVVGDYLGTEVRAVRHVEGVGTIEFGDLVSDRISVSFVSKDYTGHARVYTYLNTRGGVWTFVRGAPYAVGKARVTLHFPPGQNTNLRIHLPYGQTSGWLWVPDDATELTDTFDVRQLEAGDRLSIFAAWRSDSGDACGWLTAQPFQRGQVNSYELDMNQFDPRLSVTCTEPLNGLELHALRDSARSDYLVNTAESYPSTLMYEMAIPNFPANRWYVVGRKDEGVTSSAYEQCGVDPPLMLTVPTSSAWADYDTDSDRVTNIAVTGSADAVSVYRIYTTEQTMSYFEVFAPAGTPSLSMPVIPDSLLEAIHFPSQTLWTVGLCIYDYDAAANYDDYIGIACRPTMEQRSHYGSFYSSECLIYTSPSAQGNAALREWAKAWKRGVNR